MTPHGIAEGMARVVADHRGLERLMESLDATVWPDAVRALARAVQFECGEARPTAEHEEFAFGLYVRDLFRMPFPVTLWTGRAFSKAGTVGLLISEDDLESWRPSGEHAIGERGIGLLMMGRMLDANGTDRGWWAPLVAGRMTRTPLALDGNIRFSWRSLTQGAKSVRTGEPWDEERYAGAMDKAWRFVVGMTAMLMTPDVEQRIEPAPEKLNKARAAKGRPTIGERRTIIIKPYAREALSGEAARIAFDGRKAPKPHMRRGHFRTLARGTEVERVVPVAPCVVGVTPDAREHVKPKQYVVTP